MPYLKIKSKDNKVLGIVKVENGLIRFEPVEESKFEEHIRGVVGEGIPGHREIYDEKTRTFTLLKDVVKIDDPRFYSCLEKFLMGKDFVVQEVYPEVMDEIREILKNYPDSDEKQDILNRLPEMSYLELTAILEGLKK